MNFSKMFSLPSSDLLVPMTILWLIFNLITFVIYGLDKAIAKFKFLGRWGRISEFKLHLLSFLGGWLGAFLAQQIFRHKTRKKPFKYIFWFIGGFQFLVILGWVYFLKASI